MAARVVLLNYSKVLCAHCGTEALVPDVINNIPITETILFYFCGENCDKQYRDQNGLPEWHMMGVYYEPVVST